MEPTVLFAGGGSGGHLFPNLAVAERLQERCPAWGIHFACSDRPLDAQLLTAAEAAFTPLPVQPLPRRLRRAAAFLGAYLRSRARVAALLRERSVAAVVATGGFVSVPVVTAARRAGIPTLLLNLDAVPGTANRWLARRCRQVHCVHAGAKLPAGTRPTGMPLRRCVLGDGDAPAARRGLGLDPERPTLLVTGASQGARSLNRMMVALLDEPAVRVALREWQVLHLAGVDGVAEVEGAYEDAQVMARILPFCHGMGRAWTAATLAISRAGASSVAEVAANAVPAVFMPYPHHRDQHQQHNARPLVEAGGARLLPDRVEPGRNARGMAPLLLELMADGGQRARMREALRGLGRGDGAEQVAAEVQRLVAASGRAAESPPASRRRARVPARAPMSRGRPLRL